MSGILNQGKMLPLRMLSSLSLELTLGDPSDWLHTGLTRSTDYNIENVSLAADLITLDPALQQQYYNHILNQNLLQIKYSTYIVATQAVTGSDFSINLSRSVSRLQSIFFSFENSDVRATTDIAKRINDLYHPAQGSFDVQQDFNFQIKI